MPECYLVKDKLSYSNQYYEISKKNIFTEHLFLPHEIYHRKDKIHMRIQCSDVYNIKGKGSETVKP